jgi:hypothetical protein
VANQNEDDLLNEERGESADRLSDELAKKYDPERLLKMMSSRAGRGSSLDNTVRSRYERRFGVDLSHVRIITGEFAEKFNRDRNAHAVTIGSTGMILMGGTTDRSMASASGRALLGHELAHVAQSKRGLHFKSNEAGMPFAEEHEREAEAHEADILAEEQGAKPQEPSAQQLKEKGEAQLRRVRDRVLEMMGEAGEMQLVRAGQMRRP